jgi:ribosomal subunit interface protein
MQVNVHANHFNLSVSQKNAIIKKIEHLSHLAARLSDESSLVKVDVSYETLKRHGDVYSCHITFFVPGNTLRSEAHAETLENAVDSAVAKLRSQIEHYKAKFRRK